MKWAEIPVESACFTPAWKSAVWLDWMVGLVWTELPTPHPVIEPVSDIESGTEIFDAETGGRIGLVRGKYETGDCAF
jgi:hypothetical protein